MRSLLLGTSVLLAGNVACAQDTPTDPTKFAFSPANGNGWESAFDQATKFVEQLTLEEKVRLLTGTTGPCLGNIGPIHRLGFNGLCMSDGPVAASHASLTSTFPAGLSVAASWDKDLTRARGVALGAEFARKGVNVAFGPVVGPLGRSPFGGRWWEGFSPDPYLSGVQVANTIEGMQSSGVQACVKHFVLNEQETQRNPGPVVIDNQTVSNVEAVNSVVDDRTLHELYVWPFADAVHAGVTTIMCSYNRINGSYGCQNFHTLNEVLKKELGYQGYVLSDYGATHSGALAVNSGLDMDMPGGIDFIHPVPTYFGPNLTVSVRNGSLSEARLDDAARRVMTPYFHLRQNQTVGPIDGDAYKQSFSQPPYVYNFTAGAPNIDVRADHAELTRKAGAAGIVLLKNTDHLLPLKKPSSLGIFGSAAGDLLNGRVPDPDFGALASGGGSGAGGLSDIVSPLEAIKARAKADGTTVQYILNDTILAGPTTYQILGVTFPLGLGDILPIPEVCILFLRYYATEGNDQLSLYADHSSNDTVQKVSAYCDKTIVVINAAGMTLMPWANNPNVTVIVAAHLPGDQIGDSIADILYGDVNPSGKLPYTIAHTEEDYSYAPIANFTAAQITDSNSLVSNFTEGLLVDYRHFDKYNLSVQYEFGFGLSYTTFSLSGLEISGVSVAETNLSSVPTGATIPGGQADLWDTLYTVKATVQNTGALTGAAVSQLYISMPEVDESFPTPTKVLRGFEKTQLTAGQSQVVEFGLLRRDISYWDVGAQTWVIPAGEIGIAIGFSSRDLKLAGSISPLAD